jgi:putative copper export protein
MDESWRLIHLVAAAFWLGGMMLLAVIAIIAARTLDKPTFGRFMARAGQAFAAGAVVAGVLIAVSGAAMAWPRLGYSLSALPRTDFGRLLETKTSLAVLVVALTTVHTLAGRRTDSRRAIAVSRVVSPLLFVVTLGIFWLAVRMTDG